MRKILQWFMMLVLSCTYILMGVSCAGSSAFTSESDGTTNNSEESSTITSEEKDSQKDSNSQEQESSIPEEIPSENPSEYVDFIVDVESGRDIRVLQLTDIQTIDPAQKRYPDRLSSSEKTDTYEGYEKYINQVVERYNPDLIIMTGDNVYGEFDDSGEQFLNLISYMESFQIPWAPVFGNHDNESNMGVDWQCEQLEAAEYCLFKQRTLTGNGNYSVGLTQDGTLKRVFYMLDSNGCGGMSEVSLANGHSKTSVGFGEDQIDWYTDSVTELKKAFPDVKLSMAFHIQLQVFEKAFEKYQITAADMPIDIERFPAASRFGDFGHVGAPMKSPWDADFKVWDGLKAMGFDSIFVGHEHKNSSSISYQGVRLTYGQKSSTYDRYNSNENGPVMGGTYINLSEEDGAIASAGLYLYDHALGNENPDGPIEDEDNKEQETKITIDNIPEDAIVTEFDFNGIVFDTTVYTEIINGEAAKKLTDTSSVPDGYTGDVYSYATKNFACVGIKFPKAINADKLMAVFVKIYVTDYTITVGKTPLLRIYNNTANSILNEKSYSGLGGETGKWVYVDILELLRGASGIIENGVLSPFTLLYRFYGSTAGTVYFDSITIVSKGDI